MKSGAVVVAFLPDLQELETNLQSLRPQVDRVVLVNNGDKELLPILSDPTLVDVEIFFGANRGLAVAQNHGLKYLQHKGCGAALLMDQDSQLYSGAVDVLLQALETHPECAAVGPVYRERHTDEINSFYRVGWFHQIRIAGESIAPGEVVEVDFLIASGCLIDLDKLDQVGLMREDFFIDFIDTDWCIRARQKGFRLGAVGGELMRHTLGDRVHRVWLGKWKRLRGYKAGRYYYFFKNGAQLLRDSSESGRWRSVLILQLLRTFCVLPIVCERDKGRAILSAIRGLFGAPR